MTEAETKENEDGVKRFDLDLGEIPFELFNRRTKEVQKFVLVELDGAKRDKHTSKMSKKMEFGPDGKVQKVKTFEGINSALLAECVHRQSPDGTPGELVPEPEILSWPSKTLDQLHELASDLSGLNKPEEEDDKSKNDSSASDSSGSSSPTD